jgi:hypothetical protein
MYMKGYQSRNEVVKTNVKSDDGHEDSYISTSFNMGYKNS